VELADRHHVVSLARMNLEVVTRGGITELLVMVGKGQEEVSSRSAAHNVKEGGACSYSLKEGASCFQLPSGGQDSQEQSCNNEEKGKDNVLSAKVHHSKKMHFLLQGGGPLAVAPQCLVARSPRAAPQLIATWPPSN
jgi:hypothetical protein